MTGTSTEVQFVWSRRDVNKRDKKKIKHSSAIAMNHVSDVPGRSGLDTKRNLERVDRREKQRIQQREVSVDVREGNDHGASTPDRSSRACRHGDVVCSIYP